MKKEQSLAGVIRERLESIEERLAIGVRQEVLLAELAQAGYETSLSNFRNELWRARKRKEKKGQSAPVANQIAQPVEANSDLGELHNPKPSISTLLDESKALVEPAPGGIPKKARLEKRASQYIKGALGEQNIDSLLKPKTKG